MTNIRPAHDRLLHAGVEDARETGSHRNVTPAILYFGTPVVLLSTLNEDGSANLAPMSSAWALGWTVMLGLGAAGKSAENLMARRECVINLPSDALWQAVERLAPLTGKYPVPDWKQGQFRFEREKFAAAGLTPIASEVVRPPRVAECPLQLEATVRDVRPFGDEEGNAICVEAHVTRVHAHSEILLDDAHIAPAAWRPLIYNFRHYFGLGQELGKTFRSET
ncbi:MAG TPA: flavin reductase family protein [Ktedonobacterales bacterium]|nr:flavin reductase family protein [Ktedonobacterales bacterium]